VIREVPRLTSAYTEDLGIALDGWTFATAASDHVPAVWGAGASVLWPEGEPLMIVGPDGVGKTTLAQQVALCLAGAGDSLLGFPVREATGRVLYIAADRPQQAARSLRRMISPAHELTLRERLVVWPGPLPFDLANHPEDFARFVRRLGASVVLLDSLKDVALDLVTDETGSRVNSAIQRAIASEIEVCLLHHPRKEQAVGPKPKKLPDVYGSRWLTAGMGSVVLLWGDAGDPVVELCHLKQPDDWVGPMKILHDSASGRSTVYESADLATVLRNESKGVTVADAARLLFATPNPRRNQIESARRKLTRLCRDGRAERRDDVTGVSRYFIAEVARDPA
jgi:replicative DNA helicase